MTSHSTSPAMNAELVRAGFQAFNSGDAGQCQCLALAALDLITNLAELPEPRHGRDVWRQGFEMMKHAFPDLQAHIEDIVAAQDKVAVRPRLRGTHRGEFLGIPATGRTIEYVSHEFYRIADRLIAGCFRTGGEVTARASPGPEEMLARRPDVPPTRSARTFGAGRGCAPRPCARGCRRARQQHGTAGGEQYPPRNRASPPIAAPHPLAPLRHESYWRTSTLTRCEPMHEARRRALAVPKRPDLGSLRFTREPVTLSRPGEAGPEVAWHAARSSATLL